MDLLEPPKEPYDEEVETYGVLAEACRILEDEGIPFVVGGGVALRAYGRARPLKDTDIFLPIKYVFRAMDALTNRGGFHTRDTDGAWQNAGTAAAASRKTLRNLFISGSRTHDGSDRRCV